MYKTISGLDSSHRDPHFSTYYRVPYCLCVTPFPHTNTFVRPFTEGGNFAPDEIRRFRTRLNELNTQIVSTEELISGKLESIECGRQSFTDQQRKAFEQELRFHMIDVTYAENILRSATNTIVRCTGIVFSNPDAATINTCRYQVYIHRMGAAKNCLR